MSNTLLKSCFAALALVVGALWCRAEVPLPSDYTPLTWIQSTGSQWIDTKCTLSDNSRIEASFNTLTRTGNYTMFFGVTSKDNSTDGVGLRYMNDTGMKLSAYFCSSGNVDVQPVQNMTDTDVTVVLAKDTLIVNDTSTPIAGAGAPYQGNLYLFCCNNGGGAWRHQAMRLYSFKITDGDEAVRDFVPCRNGEGEAGLWDKVEGEFYDNRGNGRFLTSDQPVMFVGYIQSTGTQWIDTELAATVNTRIEASFNTLTRTADWTSFFGAMTDDASNNAVGLRYYKQTSNLNALFCNNTYGEVQTSGMANTDVDVILQQNKFSVNGKDYTITTANEPCTDSIVLFGETNNGSFRRGQAMKLYSFKMSEVAGDNVTVKRDLVPYVTSNWQIGLWDRVNSNFYPNSGSGLFDFGGLGYMIDGTTLQAYEGTLAPSDLFDGCTLVEKAGAGGLIAAAVTAYPALTLSQGMFSLQDGARTDCAVTGALTLKGGVRLAIDLTTDGCDGLAADSVVLDTSLTAENPVTIKVNAVGVAELSEPVTLIGGGGLTVEDAAKFVVEGFPAEVRVINGDLMLAPKSVGTFTWTGGAGDGKWSSADNWQEQAAPLSGATVVFDTAGAETTCDIANLSLKAVVFAEGAGAFSVGGNALAVFSAITNLSAATQTFTAPLALGVGETFDVVCAGEVNLHGSGSLAGDLVKGGNGTLRIDDDIVCSGRNLTAAAGKIVPNHTGRVTSAANPGEIRIAAGAQFDVDLNHSDGTKLTETEVTHGKTVIVAGDGPDGNGALYNSQIASGWGATFGHIVLTDDASIGGGRMDLRSLADSAVAPGEGSARLEGGYALTALGSWFNCKNVTHAIKQVNVQGKFGLEQGADGTVTNGVHLAGGSELELMGANIDAGIPIVVDANANIKTSGSSAGTMNGALTVNEGAALSMQLDKDLVVNGPITNNGSIVKTGGSSLVVNGGMIGGGNVEWKAGWLDLVGESDPTATLKVSGGNVHFGHGGTTRAPASAPVLSAPYAGGEVSFWFGTETTLGNGYDDFLAQVAAAKKTVRICETSPTANLILKGANWTVYNFYPGNKTDYGFLTIDEGSTVTVANEITTGNVGSSPKSTRIEVREGGKLVMNGTTFRVGYYSGASTETHQLVINGGTVESKANVIIGYDSANAYGTLDAGRLAAAGIRVRDRLGKDLVFQHNEQFRQFGGALELAANGFFAGSSNRSGHPHADLANGTLEAKADMGTTVGIFSAAFGETARGAYEIDLGGKAVTWSTALQGLSDVTLTGGGAFKTTADFQGVPKGLWTVGSGVTADLSGASGFAGGLQLEEGAAATVSIGGEGAVEMAVFSCNSKSDAFADANALVAFDGPYPYRATSFARLHATRSPGDIQNVLFGYRGQFHVPEAATYHFAGTYDDDLTLVIDGVTAVTSLGVKDGWKKVHTGSLALEAGWHDFTIVAHDAEGGQGPVKDAGHGWCDSKMALGWTTDAAKEGSQEAADYNRFDTTTLAMRVKPENEVCVLWGRKDGYQLQVLEVDPFVDAANGVLHSLQFLRTADNDTVNMLCKGQKSARLTGSFYAETAGDYEFAGVFDDYIILYIDGQEILRSPKYGQKGTGTVALSQGWHGFDLRISDNSKGVGAADALTVKKPGADAAVTFDEENVVMTASTGLGGTTTLGAGSTLTNAADGACPIYGRLEGAGALAGGFAFTEGGALCVTAGKAGIVSAPDLSGVTNDDLFLNLKTVDLTLTERVNPLRLVLGSAGSLTAEAAAEIAVRVTKPDDLKVGVWRATVANGKLVLVNPNPAGLIICIQ